MLIWSILLSYIKFLVYHFIFKEYCLITNHFTAFMRDIEIFHLTDIKMPIYYGVEHDLKVLRTEVRTCAYWYILIRDNSDRIFKSKMGRKYSYQKLSVVCVNNKFSTISKEFWEKFKLVNDPPFQITILITWGIFSYYNKIKQFIRRYFLKDKNIYQVNK